MSETPKKNDPAEPKPGGTSQPPAGQPAPKRRGRPPKLKAAPVPVEESDPLPWTPFENGLPDELPRVTAPNRPTAYLPPGSDLDEVAVAMRERVAILDFRAFGSKPRILVVIVQDVSPSEQPHEAEWSEGCRTIRDELGKAVAARNLIDIAFCTGAETFRLVSVSHGKEFVFPEGSIKYGTGTTATPWLQGIPVVVNEYVSHLGTLGLDVRDVVSVICSDFRFSDDYRAELAAFKSWCEKQQIVTVVPAVFGDFSQSAAADLASPGMSVVNLKDLPLASFFRVLSQSVVRVSQAAPRQGALAEGIARAVEQPASGGAPRR